MENWLLFWYLAYLCYGTHYFLRPLFRQCPAVLIVSTEALLGLLFGHFHSTDAYSGISVL